MDMTNVERRKLFRIEVVAPIRFRLIEESTSKPLTDWINGSTADVSLGGLKITASMPDSEVEELVDEIMHLELSCMLPGTAKDITATASIAYFLRGAAAPKATKVTFGVSFITIDNTAEDIIGEFIRKRINSPA